MRLWTVAAPMTVDPQMSSSKDIRNRFLAYFHDRGHEVVPSSPLVPGNDPTLLFTNAGMVQFKDVFLGADQRAYDRAVTAQRCVRAGGKHNDLENVGYTARHHTFFEMLGNFSFGNYFKREAIEFCWELITEEFALPKDRLWVTVFEDDDEAAELWIKHIGFDPDRVTRCGAKDNFWSMGDTGPCGPCSEIFYDHGPGVWGGPPGTPEEDGDRYVELWNLVFMQFNRDAQGTMTPLPAPSVDTGMGLERIAAVLQGVQSNYDTDLFQALIKAAAEVTHTEDLTSKSLHVIADHIRSCAFLVCDGVVPSNEGRGYVLRRIIRRALRHGHKLGTNDLFFHKLVGALVVEMGEAYPELAQRQAAVARVLRQEEERFAQTLDQGMRILNQSVAELSGTEIPGETVFKLYDTFGFPVDLTADIARERNLSVDLAAFESAMDEQRERARKAGRWVAEQTEGLAVEGETEFRGYDCLTSPARVREILVDGQSTELLGTGQAAMVVTEVTPFYAESGGQIGDRGSLTVDEAVFQVEDVQRQGAALLHIGRQAKGELRTGDQVVAAVDPGARQATARNHSATHLLHAALRTVLGDHVQQKGSLVAPDRLRFDFSHFEAVTPGELREIEDQVNDWILKNEAVQTQVMPLDEARNSGAVALFGEKYDDPVRVLSVGSHSTELCGGTHVSRTGDIGLFKLVSEGGIAAGTRRIEALTGAGAGAWVRGLEAGMNSAAELLKSDRDTVPERIEQLLGRSRELERELERLKQRLATSQGDDLAAQAVEISGINVLAARVEGADAKGLRNTVDQLKAKLKSAAVVLATVQGQKVSLAAGVTDDCTDRVAAGPLVNFVAQQVGGRGGGRADMAQAGGNDPGSLDSAIASVPDWVREQVSN